jgi:hypothetical protein
VSPFVPTAHPHHIVTAYPRSQDIAMGLKQVFQPQITNGIKLSDVIACNNGVFIS